MWQLYKCVSFQKFLIQNFISSLTKLAQSRSFKISSLSGGTNLAHTEMCIASHTCHWQIFAACVLIAICQLKERTDVFPISVLDTHTLRHLNERLIFFLHSTKPFYRQLYSNTETYCTSETTNTRFKKARVSDHCSICALPTLKVHFEAQNMSLHII